MTASIVVIRAEGLGKLYKIGHSRQAPDTLRDALTLGARRIGSAVSKSLSHRRLSRPVADGRARDESVWALRGLDLEVHQGEVMGVIGANGAGKSTLLRILARITQPTEGKAVILGRLGSLLEVGTGFHPELSGRENIYLNGAILGMRRKEIAERFDEIVEFAGIGKFLDTPVKRYSSGMYVRLAFAVAAHLDPDILLVDEVLAVGDMAFQEKCLGKMHGLARSGRTILFVSHNMAAIQALCTRAILLSEGRLCTAGDPREVVSAYVAAVQAHGPRRTTPRSEGDEGIIGRLTDVHLESADGQRISTALSGAPVVVAVAYTANRSGLRLDVGIGLYTALGEKLLHFSTRYSAIPPSCWPPHGTVRCHIPRLPLPQGSYRINVTLRDKGQLLDRLDGAATLYVQAGDYYNTGRIPPPTETKVLVDHTWELPDA